MQDFALHRPMQLSGGQQQRVAIARALVGEPDVILADEPTGALDSHTSQDIMTLFLSLHSEGRTLILITHDERVASTCSRQITLDDGKIVAELLL
jgi:putative ABC transport system ATP-binding protein